MQGPTFALTEEHRKYLLHRHGTLDLEPVPDMTDNDPYNWPKHKASRAIVDPIRSMEYPNC